MGVSLKKFQNYILSYTDVLFKTFLIKHLIKTFCFIYICVVKICFITINIIFQSFFLKQFFYISKNICSLSLIKSVSKKHFIN